MRFWELVTGTELSEAQRKQQRSLSLSLVSPAAVVVVLVGAVARAVAVGAVGVGLLLGAALDVAAHVVTHLAAHHGFDGDACYEVGPEDVEPLENQQ